MLQRFIQKHYPELWARYRGEVVAERFQGDLEAFIKEFNADIYECYLRLTRPIMVLRALLAGLPVEHGGGTYCLDIDYRLCKQGVSINTGTGEETPILLVVDMGDGIALKDFVKWAMRFSDDELFILAATAALNEV